MKKTAFLLLSAAAFASCAWFEPAYDGPATISCVVGEKIWTLPFGLLGFYPRCGIPITVNELGTTKTTDEEGRVEFEGLDPGTYTLTCRFPDETPGSHGDLYVSYFSDTIESDYHIDNSKVIVTGKIHLPDDSSHCAWDDRYRFFIDFYYAWSSNLRSYRPAASTAAPATCVERP